MIPVYSVKLVRELDPLAGLPVTADPLDVVEVPEPDDELLGLIQLLVRWPCVCAATREYAREYVAGRVDVGCVWLLRGASQRLTSC